MRNSFGIMLVLAIAAVSPHAWAERSRSGGKAGGTVSSAMEGVEWGWGHEKVVGHFSSKLRRLYQPLLNKATDAMTEDRLRRRLRARIGRIKNSHVVFRGQRTGWDSSLIRDQYTHNNGESLVEVREVRAGGQDPRYTDYFFFINDLLWRRYRAFNQDQFAGIPFEKASASFTKRFGKGRAVRGANKSLKSLEWTDRTTSLRAIDNTEFYGVFCLVFTERATEARLAKLRKNKRGTKQGVSPLVQSLEAQGDDGADRHSDVVEHITGQHYNSPSSKGRSKR